MTAGIYKLELNGLPYVGKSDNIELRFKQHLNELKLGTHNYKLQQAYEEYGTPTLKILESMFKDKLYMASREQYWIGKLCSITKGYNIVNSLGSEKKLSYEDEKIIEAFLSINKLPDLDICLNTGITDKMLKSIKQGTNFTWLQFLFPTEYKQLRVTTKSTGYSKNYKNF